MAGMNFGNKKVSQEDAADALTGAELVRIVQGGRTKRTTTQDIADLGNDGSGAPGGLDTQVQFNDNGALGGDAQFVFDSGTKTILLGTEAGLPAALVFGLGYNRIVDQSAGYGLIASSFTGNGGTGVLGQAYASAFGFPTGVFGYAIGAEAASWIVGVSGSGAVDGVTNTGVVAAFRAGTGQEFGSGVITNNYGLYVDDMTTGVNNWAIRTGAGKVQFGELNASQVVFTDADKNLVSKSPPTITGSRDGNAALASLLTASQTMGLIVDGTS